MPQIPNWSGVNGNFIKFEIKKGKTSNNSSRVFGIALEGGKEGMEILPGRASIIRCFCHAKRNIQ